jgi:hypothetical protein
MQSFEIFVFFVCNWMSQKLDNVPALILAIKCSWPSITVFATDSHLLLWVVFDSLTWSKYKCYGMENVRNKIQVGVGKPIVRKEQRILQN